MTTRRASPTDLGAVGVWAGIGHGQQAGLGVLQQEVLVGELLPVDGLASGTFAHGCRGQDDAVRRCGTRGLGWRGTLAQ